MKFKTVRTLRGLAIPGWLTAEYLEGRRQRYLTPFKVYLAFQSLGVYRRLTMSVGLRRFATV